jgi:hypothetical protein
MPSTCGDKYGDMTAAFTGAVNLKPKHKDGEWKAVRNCLDRLSYLADYNAAKYISNPCHVVYSIVAPPGSGSNLERKNLGHYAEHLRACKVYWEIIERNKHTVSEHELSRQICQAWSIHAVDFTRSHKHHKQDMSYANDMLEDHGCSGWPHYHK